MSISKTLLLLISAVLPPLLVFPACAPRYTASGPQQDHAALAQTTAPAEPSVAGEEQWPGETDHLAADLTLAEPEKTAAEEIEALAAIGTWEEGPGEPVAGADEYDFPVVINRQVEFYLDFFQKKQHQSFARWLARSGRYLPMIEEELRQAGLPLDLAYLPMIESGYSLTACSPAKAVGPWQFMSATARHYGLRIDSHVDERRDPVKSTRAAVRYLARLHEEFGSWQLAVAGYNAGEGKIRSAMRQADTNNFWQLSPHLHLETTRYVPKLIAAIIIAKNPEKYGFTGIPYDEPLDFEIAEVDRWTPLEAVAVACDVDIELLQELNRELLQAVAPPHLARYPLKVPRSKAEVLARNLPRVRPVIATRYKTHVVSKQETLAQISRKYSLNKTTLLKANNLRSARLEAGQRLRIPYQDTTYQLLPAGRVGGYKPAPVSDKNLRLHTVRPGETVSSIAREYNLPASLIATWNNLDDMNRVRTGQQLALYVVTEEKAGGRREQPLVIEPKTFKLASAGAETDRTLLNAPKEKPAGKNAEPASRLTYYQVRGGDTLSTIARKFKISTDEIKRWNQLEDDVIHPGSRLLLRVEEDADA
jgi:membrane-bound lytic murein transglycosylase D